jgi:hypothetical protein
MNKATLYLPISRAFLLYPISNGFYIVLCLGSKLKPCPPFPTGRPVALSIMGALIASIADQPTKICPTIEFNIPSQKFLTRVAGTDSLKKTPALFNIRSPSESQVIIETTIRRCWAGSVS